MTKLSKSPDFVKSTSEFPFKEFPSLYEQLVPESKVSVSTITTGDLPTDMGMHILQSKKYNMATYRCFI